MHREREAAYTQVQLYPSMIPVHTEALPCPSGMMNMEDAVPILPSAGGNTLPLNMLETTEEQRLRQRQKGAVTFSYIYEQAPLKAGYQSSCGKSLSHTQRGRRKTQSSMRNRPGTVRSLTLDLQCPLNDCPCAIKPPIVFLLLWSLFLKTPMWNLLYKFVIHFSLANLCLVMGCQL